AWIAEGAAALARLYQHHRECHEHGATRMPKREAMALGLDGDALDRGRHAGSGQRLPTTEGSQPPSDVPGRPPTSPQQSLTRAPCSPSHRRLTSISAATASQMFNKKAGHPLVVFVGTPYGQNQQLLVTDDIGGSPYGPGTLAGTDGSRQPVEAELTTARN